MTEHAPNDRDKELRIEKLFLRKIAKEWEAIVNTGRMKRRYQKLREKDKENEIQKQERIEWERFLREEGID